MMLLKGCTQYISTFGKLSSVYRTGKVQLSFQSPRRVMPKKVQTATKMCWCHILAKYVLVSNLIVCATIKILQERLQQYMNWEPPDVQTEFRKGTGTTAQIDSICWIIGKAREFQKKTFASASLPVLRLLTVLFRVALSCLTLCNPMDCSPPASSVHSSPGKNTGVVWLCGSQ